jgi:UrcA family protein
MEQTFRIIFVAFLATAGVIKAVPALAEPVPTNVNVSVVRTADLNLSTDAGRRQLDQRLVIAAREVCGATSDADLAGKNAVRACRKDVLAQARAKTGEVVAGRAADRTVLVAVAR